jgi:hypothetical protein
MWEPQRLTTLWASTACYRDSFALWLNRPVNYATGREYENKILNLYPPFRSRDSSVGIATGYWLGFDSRQGKEIFLHSTASEAVSGTEPASYPISNVVLRIFEERT